MGLGILTVRASLRDTTLQIRVSEVEKEKAVRVADKMGTSLSAAYRMAMNRFYDELFKEQHAPPHR